MDFSLLEIAAITIAIDEEEQQQVKMKEKVQENGACTLFGDSAVMKENF